MISMFSMVLKGCDSKVPKCLDFKLQAVGELANISD